MAIELKAPANLKKEGAQKGKQYGGHTKREHDQTYVEHKEYLGIKDPKEAGIPSVSIIRTQKVDFSSEQAISYWKIK